MSKDLTPMQNEFCQLLADGTSPEKARKTLDISQEKSLEWRELQAFQDELAKLKAARTQAELDDRSAADGRAAAANQDAVDEANSAAVRFP